MSQIPEEKPKQKTFPTTRWTLVVNSSSKDSTGAEFFDRLCSDYWHPLYAFLRRRGHSPEDAEDLTQGFLAKLAAREGFTKAEASKGKFRTFLLTALVRYAGQEHRKANALKRGGGSERIPADFAEAEQIYGSISSQEPSSSFDRVWALTLLTSVIKKLAREAEKKGRTSEFTLIKPHLLGSETSPDYDAIAAASNIADSAAKVRVHRMKLRYRERLREAIGETLDSDSEDEIDAELLYLVACLREETDLDV